ncbi:MAG: hypothetical protein QM741_06505 [Rudaea sp.]|uniref:serine O-acetyltransferase n=1 Tax=Rudaea sp. TaxID=2136325 RepID=UPI0039E72981
MFDNLRQDFLRYHGPRQGGSNWLAGLRVLTEYGFLAICVYRYGRWTRAIRPLLLSYPFKLVYRILNTLVEILFGISVSTNFEIGPGFYIGHFSCIFVHGTLGRNCAVGQGVTIGSKGAGKSNGNPQIGDNVYIGAGAKVLGRIRVGNDVIVGANTVVVKDVPDRTRVVGSPAIMTPIVEVARPQEGARFE